MASGVNFGTQQYFGFDPSTIPGCALWLDAADLGTFTPSNPTGGTAISQWNDKSGNGRHATQATSGNRPVYSSSDISVDTTTNPRFFNMTNMPAAPYDIFVVARPVSGTTDWRTLFRTNTTDPGMNPIVLEAGSTRLGYFTSTAFAQFGSLTWAASTRNLLFARMNGTKTMNASLNGAISLTANTAAGTASDVILYMGALVVNGSVFQQWGNINEVIFYTTPLTTIQRQQVEGYLAWKWGLQGNLPIGHPFRQNPTTMRLFQPVDVGDCCLWLDADDLSTFTPLAPTSGTTITAWRDKSSNGLSCASVLAPSANPIQYRTTTGLPSVYINNNNNNLNNTSTNAYLNIPSNIQNGFSNFTYIGVLNSGNNGGAGNLPRLQSWYVNNRDASLDRRIQLGPNFFEWNAVGGIFAGADEIVSRSVNTRIICTFISDTSRFSWLINGTPCQIITTTTGTKIATDVGTTPRIGASLVDNRNTTGDFYEVICYNRAISDEERTNIETYLSRKWNVVLDNASPSVSSALLVPNDPSISANLQIWNDATSYSTNNQVLTTWVNRTGGTASSCTGTVLTNQLNSRPIVRFATTATYATPSVNYSSYTMFMVARHNGIGAYSRILQGPSGQNILYGYWGGYKNVLYINNNPSLLSGNGRARLADTLWDIMSHRRVNGGAYNLRFAQSTIYSGSTSEAANFIQGLINTGGIPAETSTCDIAEIIIYNTTLSDTQMRQIENYLNEKWNVYPTNRFPFYGAPPSTPLFTPTALSNCSLWLDALDNSRITTSGASVTSVLDKAQNITLTTQGTSSFLTVATNTINGRQSLYFNNGSANNVHLSGTLNNITAGTMVLVFQAAAQLSDFYRPFFTWTSTGGLNFPAFGYTNAGPNVISPYTTFVGPGTPTNTVTVGSNYLAFYSWTGTTTNVGINGTTSTAGSQSGYGSTNSTVRICWDNGQTTTTYLGEIILFSRVINTSERQQLEGYLAWKWGLQPSLPTTHPYYKFRP